MKTSILLLFIVSNTWLMCENDTPVNSSNSKVNKEFKETLNESTSLSDSFLGAKKSADYSSLFTQDKNICLTIDDVSKATGLPIYSISEGEKFNKLYCYFDIKLPDGSMMKYSYTAMKYGENQNMKKELKNLEKDKKFKKKSFGMFTELSETSDTYLVHSRLRGEIRIMNSNYPVIILTKYSSIQDKLTKEQKIERDVYATKIANFLLLKHKI